MKRFQDKRVWLGGGALAAFLVVAVGWFMFIGPQRSSTNDLNVQTASTAVQNAQLQAKLSALKNQSSQVGRYTRALKAALSALPFDSGLPAFTRQLSAQGASDHVTVSSVVVGGVTPVTSAAAPAATSAATAAATTDPSSTSGATPATAPATGAATAAGGLYSVQVTVQSSGAMADQLAFLSDITTAGPRRALVTSTQITPGAAATTGAAATATALTTQLTIFSAPQTSAQIAQLKALLSGKIGN